MTSTRKTQIYTALIKKFIEEVGRPPTEAELNHLAGTKLYAPMTTPVVPKNRAISNPEHFKDTVGGLLDDGYDIMDLIEAQKDTIKQLRVAMQARQEESLTSIRDSIHKVQLQETLEDSTATLVGVLPGPVTKLSTGIDYTGHQVTLASDHSYALGYSVVDVSPFTEKAVRRSLVGKFTMPYSAIVEAAKGSAYSGVQLQLLLEEDAMVTRLHYEGSAVFATIEVLNADSAEWQKVVSKQLSGRDDIAISKNAIRLRLTLTQDVVRSMIRITDLRLFQERYAPSGLYTPSPFKISGTGSITVTPDTYAPDGTSVGWEYSIDHWVSGDYVIGQGVSVPLDSPAYAEATYSSTADSTRTYADVVDYDLDQQYQSPIWKALNGEILYNNESGTYPEYTGTQLIVQDQAPLIDLATINTLAVDKMVNITYGKDAWIFRAGTLERAVIDESGIRRMAMTGFPHWMTHILVDTPFIFSALDPFDRISYILLELNGHVLVLQAPFTYTLTRGIWKCTLVMDDEYISTQEGLSAVNRAINYGIDPRTAVPMTDRNGVLASTYIHPYPVPIVSAQRIETDPDYTDFQRAAISLRNDGKHVIVPDMSVDPSTMDLVSTAFEVTALSDIYTVTNAPLFFDITYMQEVANPVSHIFLRATMQTTDKRKTPVIRGVSLALGEVRKEPPAAVKRLSSNGNDLQPLD